MKHLYYLLPALLLSLVTRPPAGAQSSSEAFPLGTTQDFLQQLKQNTQASPNTNGRTANASSLLTLPVSATQTLSLRVNVQEAAAADQLTLIGSVVGEPNSSFYLRVEGDNLVGDVLLKYQGQAYEYTADAQGNAFVEAKDLDEVLCVRYPEQPGPVKAQASDSQREAVAAAPRALESLPGAPRCMLLDFDGEYVAGTPWNEGRPINAAPAAMSSSKAEAAWALVSEDFRPFNVNITTSEAVFNRYPKDRRMRCIITPTNTAAPGAGGVAIFGSFKWNDDTPCWVFMDDDPKSSGEAISHELGHTVDLGHDTAPGAGPDGYYTGQGDWSPIMGVGYYKPVTQWNKGEYRDAYNRQDDLATIEGFLGYRGDDHSDQRDGATLINVQNNRIDQQTGIIERTSDQDFFRFRCGKGEVSFDIQTVDNYGNLDIQATLYQKSGDRIKAFNDPGLNVKVNAQLDAGEYYLAIDGVGAGNPRTTGYSDYGSLGSFTITGTVAGSGNDNDDGVVVLYRDCNFGGSAVVLQEGSYSLDKLRNQGMRNDDISSLKVKAGYQVTLYVDDNFQGRSVTFTQDNACLTEANLNNQLSSLKVSKKEDQPEPPRGEGQLVQAEDYSSMKGVQTEPTEDQGGGLNVGYLDKGDKLTYEGVQLTTGGTYTIEYRIASRREGNSLVMLANGQSLGTVKLPKIGGWQDWRTVKQTVSLEVGTYSFMILSNSGEWNINWWRITPQGDQPKPPTAVASFYQDCDFRGKRFELSEGRYDLAALRARGYTNDQLSSFRVENGYEVLLYQDDAFGGNAALAYAGQYACLVDYDFNDEVSSIVVRSAGTGGAAARTDQTLASKASTELLRLVESDQSEITVYPNPVVSHLTVGVPSEAWEDSHMSIINTQGKRVWKGPYQPALDMSRFEKGIYTVLIDKSGQRRVRRFIKE